MASNTSKVDTSAQLSAVFGHKRVEMGGPTGAPAATSVPQRTFSISSQVVPGLMVALDSLVILSVALITYSAIVGVSGDADYYGAAIGFVWLASILLMNFAGLYQFESIMRPLTVADKIAIAFATTFLFLLAAAFSLKVSTEYSRIWIVSFAIGTCTATLFFRLVASRILGRLADMRVFSRNVVIIGAGEQARQLLAHIEIARPRFVSVLGLFADGPHDLADSRYPTLGRPDELASYVRDHDVDDVIISLPWSADDQITRLMSKLRELPVNVYLGADLVGFRLPLRQRDDHFGEMPLTEVMGRPLAGWGVVGKAALDYGLGIVLTVLLLPVLTLIASAIKLESTGPVLFRQERYVFVNRLCPIYKFRTMNHTSVC